MLRAIMLLVCLCGSTFAQGLFTVPYDAGSLSSAAMGLTVQQPASNAFAVRFKSVTVSCPQACKVEIIRNGTPATTTLIPGGAVNPNPDTAGVSAPRVQVFSSSNASGGTVVGVHYLGGGNPVTIGLNDIFFTPAVNPGRPRQSLTIRTSAVTGSGSINVNGEETRPL